MEKYQIIMALQKLPKKLAKLLNQNHKKVESFFNAH